MRLIHGRRRRTVVTAARAWPLKRQEGEVGKHGRLFLFDLIRGLEKGKNGSKTSWKVGDRWKERPGSGYSPTLQNQSTARLISPLLEIARTAPRRVFW